MRPSTKRAVFPLRELTQRASLHDFSLFEYDDWVCTLHDGKSVRDPADRQLRMEISGRLSQEAERFDLSAPCPAMIGSFFGDISASFHFSNHPAS